MLPVIEESFEKQASEESAKSLFQFVLSILTKFGAKKIDSVKVKVATKSYIERFIERHGQMKVLGMPEPVLLTNVYTAVKMVYPSHQVKSSEIEILHEQFNESRNHFAGVTQRLDGIDLANNKKLLNILGAPGSGKSTFLRKIGIECLLKSHVPGSNTRYEHDCIPVLIELRRIRNEGVDLYQLIQKEFEIAGFPESKYFLEAALKEQKLLILLDGLDEVPSSMITDTIGHIKDFTDKHTGNRFITSCRTAFYKTFFKNFTDVEIASFDNFQVSQFVENWFSLEKDKETNTASSFLKLIFDPINSSALELARTPLLLTFLCLTFDTTLRFPHNRSSLYKRSLEILLERWAAEKRIHNEDIYQDFNSALEIEMLAQIAAKFFIHNKIFFYEKELKGEISSFVSNALNLKSIDVGKVLEAIEVQQGLLVQRAVDIYSFSHLTIQEYLTAHYFYSPGKFNQLVSNHLFDPRWREVFLLVSGTSNAEDTLSPINERLKQYRDQSELLGKSVKWIDGLIEGSDDYEKDSCKRVFLLSLLLRFKRHYYGMGKEKAESLVEYPVKLLKALNPSFSKSFALRNHINPKLAVSIIDLVSSWQKDPPDRTGFKDKILSCVPKKPLSKMLEGSRHNYRKEIVSHLYEALGVPDDLGFLRADKYDEVTKYLEAYTLLVDCKSASLRISKDVWKDICESMVGIN